MSETADVKYVFLDIVGFTNHRSVEAQSDLIDGLNCAVENALKDSRVDESQRILLPTGDGMAIALLDAKPFDVHLKLAIQILRHVSSLSESTNDKMRKFAVRI